MGYNILIGGIVFIAIILSVFNISSNDEFFVVNVDSILGLLGLALITLAYTKMDTKRNKKLELITEVLNGIQLIRSQNDSLITRSDSDYKHFLMLNTDLRTKIAILKKFSIEFKFTEECDYLESQNEEYDMIVTNDSNSDVIKIKMSYSKLDKILLNIENKCIAIKFKIYQ